MLVLKSLGRARADGDRIWGLVRGSAINQNGTSAGLPVPNGPAQQRVIEQALDKAEISPADVDYLEAHATGTDLGDSIELRALASVYGRGRTPEQPLLVGSVKTNIGHAEWASGMASIIKAIMAMHRGVIPAHLHFERPNPEFDWDRLPVRVTSSPARWPLIPDKPLLAAVNSFGMSGANAHVILEGMANGGESVPGQDAGFWPAGDPRPVVPSASREAAPAAQGAEAESPRSARLLPLSGKSPAALRDLASGYLEWLENLDEAGRSGEAGDSLLADAAWTAGKGRSHFPHRSGIVFRDADGLRAGLLTAAGGTGTPEGQETAPPARAAFYYPGRMDDAGGWGEALYRREPVFRHALDRCEEIALSDRGESLLSVMLDARNSAENLGLAEASPWGIAAGYALGSALTALWKSLGIVPAAVFGNGFGEITAAQAAGVLTLEEGMRLALVWGDPNAAYPVLEPRPPSLALLSGLTGDVVPATEKLDGSYWRRLAQQPDEPAQFGGFLRAQRIDVVISQGHAAGSNGTQGAGTTQFSAADWQPHCLDSLPGTGDAAADADLAFLRAVAGAYEAGMELDWNGLFSGEMRRRISLPHYPFQRRSFWVQRRARNA